MPHQVRPVARGEVHEDVTGGSPAEPTTSSTNGPPTSRAFSISSTNSVIGVVWAKSFDS